MTVLLFRHLTDPGTFFRPFDADRKPNRFRSTYNDTLRALAASIALQIPRPSP